MKAVVTPYRSRIGSACETLQGHYMRMTIDCFMGGGAMVAGVGGPRTADFSGSTAEPEKACASQSGS